MKVLPQETTWDGVDVYEEVKMGTGSTCTEGLTTAACTGGAKPFRVGAGSEGSKIVPKAPAEKNRFYDYHGAKKEVSLLHDATRNPKRRLVHAGLRQTYKYDGKAIGTHPITKTFLPRTCTRARTCRSFT